MKIKGLKEEINLSSYTLQKGIAFLNKGDIVEAENLMKAIKRLSKFSANLTNFWEILSFQIETWSKQ